MKKKRLLFINLVLLVLIILIASIMSGCEEYKNQPVDNNLQKSEGNKEQEDNQNNEGTVAPVAGANTDNEAPNNATNITNATNAIIGGGKIITNSLNEKEEGEAEKNRHIKTDDDVNIANKSNLLIEIYYQDIEGLIIPVTRRIPKQLSVARSAINGLIDTPLNRESMSYFGLIPILPKGTEFTINLKGSTAIIDFNNKVLDYNSKKSEQNIVSSIVYTLTQFESIDKVKILINGYEQSELNYGTDISKTLSREDILINSFELDRVNLHKGMRKLDVYLLKSVKDTVTLENNDVFLIPVSLEIADMDKDMLIDYIMNYLSVYKSEQKLFSAVNQAIILNKSKMEEGLLTLDLSIDTANYGGTLNEYFMVNQILHSMKEFSGIDKINILVDGKAVGLPEGTDISSPVTFPIVINDIVDEEGYD